MYVVRPAISEQTPSGRRDRGGLSGIQSRERVGQQSFFAGPELEGIKGVNIRLREGRVGDSDCGLRPALKLGAEDATRSCLDEPVERQVP